MIDETIDRIGRRIILNTLRKNAHFSASVLAPVLGVDTKTVMQIAKHLGVKLATSDQFNDERRQRRAAARASAIAEGVAVKQSNKGLFRCGANGQELDEIRRKYAAASGVVEIKALAAEYGFTVERLQKVIRR